MFFLLKILILFRIKIYLRIFNYISSFLIRKTEKELKLIQLLYINFISKECKKLIAMILVRFNNIFSALIMDKAWGSSPKYPRTKKFQILEI